MQVLFDRQLPRHTAQCALLRHKYALRGFTEAVRAELTNDGSRVHLTMVHPPAVNTPFYQHATLHLDRPVRPPPPVYQPELIADAIYLAATSRRREVKVTEQTIALALGNKLAPGLMDYLAGKDRRGAAVAGCDHPVAERDPNLDRPGRNNAIHGPFDAESLSSSPQMWANRNRDAIGFRPRVDSALAGLLAGRGAPDVRAGHGRRQRAGRLSTAGSSRRSRQLACGRIGWPGRRSARSPAR